MALVALVVALGRGASADRTAITVWAAQAASANPDGGDTYAGASTPTGALITEQRELEVGTGEVRIEDVAATLDPASVRVRGISDPQLAVTEQRFVPGAATPDDIIARRIGEQVSVTTAKGEVVGVLRAVDKDSIVLEVGTGAQRQLRVLHRDGFVQDVKLAPGGAPAKPSLAVRLATAKPGKQTVEVSYRTDGLAWSADYLAVIDEAAKAFDFSGWATIKNASGTSFDNAQVTLVSSQPSNAKPGAGPTRFAISKPVHIGENESVQVELLPPRLHVKAHTVVTYEAIPDVSAVYRNSPSTECSNVPGTADKAEVALEVDVPGDPLADGKVRLFARKGTQLDLVSEDSLRTAIGLARVRVMPTPDLVGERKILSCTLDERTRTLREKVEIGLENKARQPVEAIAREFMWRAAAWKIEPGDETVKGARAAAQTQEYRLMLPAGVKKSVVYTVTYSW
jgi:hypothetical protein